MFEKTIASEFYYAGDVKDFKNQLLLMLDDYLRLVGKNEFNFYYTDSASQYKKWSDKDYEKLKDYIKRRQIKDNYDNLVIELKKGKKDREFGEFLFKFIGDDYFEADHFSEFGTNTGCKLFLYWPLDYFTVKQELILDLFKKHLALVSFDHFAVYPCLWLIDHETREDAKLMYKYYNRIKEDYSIYLCNTELSELHKYKISGVPWALFLNKDKIAQLGEKENLLKELNQDFQACELNDGIYAQASPLLLKEDNEQSLELYKKMGKFLAVLYDKSFHNWYYLNNDIFEVEKNWPRRFIPN